MILTTAKEYLASTSNVRIAHLVQIELAGTEGVFAYMTDYFGNVTYNGVEYVAGKVVSVGSVRLLQGIKSYTLQVNVAGEFQEEIDRGTTELSYEGRRINVFRAYLDGLGNIIPFDNSDNGPVRLFQGSISGISVNEDVTKGESVITWECAGLLHDFEKINGRVTDDVSHRGLVSSGLDTTPVPSSGAKKLAYKTDTGFQHANQTISASISYVGKEKEYYLKKSMFGLKSKLKEREVEVTRNLDIKTSLEARHLPVVYGVRRLPGIPVFLDSLKSDPSRMYAIYAVCEGEIESYLDIYIDGVSAICSSSTSAEATGVCLGNKQQGDTLSIYRDASRSEERNTGWGKFPYDRDNMSYDSNAHITNPASSSTTGTKHLDEFNIAAEKGAVWVKFYHGTSTQTPDSILTGLAQSGGFLLQSQLKKQDGSSWGPEYWQAASEGISGSALLDTAYVLVAFSITEDRSEIPNIEVVVSGKKPIVLSSVSTYTNSYTLNPVWHLLDYLVDPIFGGGLDLESDIDHQSFINVAAKLDTADTSYSSSFITWWRYIGWLNNNYSTAIMQCNTILATDNSVTKNVESLLNQFSGTLNPINGKYHLSIEDDSAAVADLDIGEVIGRVTVKDTPNKDKWNSIQASIVDPAMDWSTNQISFFDSTYLTEDNNIHKKGNAVFSYITNYYTARAWAQRALNISRSNRVLRFNTYYKYSWLIPNDNITFTYPRLGYTQEKFRVIEVDILSDGTVSLAIELYDPDAYVPSDQPKVNPPSSSGSSVTPPVGLNFYYLPSPTVLISIDDPTVVGALTWGSGGDLTGILRYEGWYGPVDGPVGSRTLISVLPTQVATVASVEKHYELVQNLEPDTDYVFKIQSVSTQGVKSPYSVFYLQTDSEVIPTVVPKVNNFILVNKAPDGTFIGPNVELSWTGFSTTSYSYYYELEFRDATNSAIILLLQLTPATNTYTLTLGANMAAYLSLEGTVGAYRHLIPRIRRVASNANVSEWSSIT